jgi:8-oxo-dGTP diphosphatase
VIRDEIRDEVDSVCAEDPEELETKSEVLSWINSGAQLFRLEKPATPPRHLVSYFALIDGDHILLVDHINARLWLPTGGHVEQDEHPQAAALREAKEELGIDGEFLYERPLLVTSTETVGRTAGHTDVSLWYVMKGDRTRELVFDESEFRSVRWFHKDMVPLDRSDPHMGRFLKKVRSLIKQDG